ncbi:MAG: hypothetical protein KC464_05720, partial [Myxococcales bacterium]|nr:hypothetical protein [Myxococcales bacterium]
MSLGHSIDRVDYDQLVAEAQRRIAARSRGQWTMHGPVDPGITLLELYAWLLDQRVYRADRTPEPMVQAILGVLGEGLAPARAAGVVLELSPPGPRRLGRFAVQVARRPELTFTTRRAIAVAPVDAIELQTWEGDRTADLGRRPVPLLRADGAAAEAT